MVCGGDEIDAVSGGKIIGIFYQQGHILNELGQVHQSLAVFTGLGIIQEIGEDAIESVGFPDHNFHQPLMIIFQLQALAKHLDGSAH